MEELTKLPNFLSGFEIPGFKVQHPPPVSLALLMPNSVYVACSFLKWIQLLKLC